MIFKASSVDAQRALLEMFQAMAEPGLSALGSIRGDEYFVIVDCHASTIASSVERIVLATDSGAARVFQTIARRGIQRTGGHIA